VGNRKIDNYEVFQGFFVTIAAFGGAGALVYDSNFGALATYAVGSRIAVITPVKLALSLFMLVYAVFELLPAPRNRRFSHTLFEAGRKRVPQSRR
jgi:hypothetical protein